MQENQPVQTDNFNLTGVTAGSVKSAMKEAGATSRDLWYVPINEIVQLEDFNVRVKNDEYFSAVRAIADSIKENGFYPHKPIACMVIKRNGKDVLAVIDGHTRLDAAILAISEGAVIDKLPVVTTQAGTTLEDAIAGLATNNSGKPLTPMALGIVCKRLVSFGWTNSKVAAKLAISVAYVGQLLQLVSAEKEIRDLVNEDKISATLAVQTMNAEGEQAAKVLQAAVETAKAAGKDKATAKHVSSSKAPAKPAKVTLLGKAIEPEKEEKEIAQTPETTVQSGQESTTETLTPFDALKKAEDLHQVQTTVQKAVQWLKGNIGIIDESHYELAAVMTGFSMESLQELVNA
jgi:ParB family chromosome partitioning protein